MRNNGSIYIPLNPIKVLSGWQSNIILGHSCMHVYTCLPGWLPIVLQLTLTLRLCILSYQVPNCTSTLMGGRGRGLCMQCPLAYPDDRLGVSNPRPSCQESDALTIRSPRPLFIIEHLLFNYAIQICQMKFKGSTAFGLARNTRNNNSAFPYQINI